MSAQIEEILALFGIRPQNQDRLQQLLKPSPFYGESLKLTLDMALQAGLLSTTPPAVLELEPVRKALSIWLLNDLELGKAHKNDILTHTITLLSMNLNNGALCAEDWWREGALLRDYSDCRIKNEVGMELLKKKFEDSISSFVSDAAKQVAMFLLLRGKGGSLIMLAAMEAIFQLGVTLALCDYSKSSESQSSSLERKSHTKL